MSPENIAEKATVQTPEQITKKGHRVPWWMWLVIIVCALPGLAFPLLTRLIEDPNPAVRGLTWLYPCYVLCSGVLAWQCYGRRSYVTWIILALLLISHVCFFYLAFLALSSPNLA